MNFIGVASAAPFFSLWQECMAGCRICMENIGKVGGAMIVSASRRTDIPAFYFDWFCERLRDGYVDVVNPFNRKQVSRISLKPEAVDCIVFWTKDPAPMLRGLDKLSAYPYYVQISITPYGKDIEANLRPKADIIKTVQELSRRLDRERVVW